MSDTLIRIEDVEEAPSRPAMRRDRGQLFPRTRREGLVIAAIFTIVYAAIGYLTVADGHIVQFGALERLADAYMAWWNDPPKLAAIGLSSAPVGTLSFLAPALIKPFATSLSAIPIATAVAGGGTMAMINATLARCGFSRQLRWIAVALVGLNPMTVFYAGNGSPEMLAVFFGAAALLALISWKITDETRYLIGAGLSLGVAVMVDYSFLAWGLAFIFAIAFIGPGPRGGQTKLRASLLLYLTPVFYAVLVWSILNAIILKNPFQWVEIGSVQNTPNLNPAIGLISAQIGTASSDLVTVILGVAPLLFLAVPLLLISALSRRDSLGFGLVVIGVLAVAAILGTALLEDRASLVSLRTGLPLVIIAIATLAWLFREEEDWRPFIGLALLIGLAAAIPLSWHAMRTYDHQNQEQAFTRFVESRGESQEGTKSLGGYTVGIDPELAMANYINDKLQPPENSVLTDSKITYGVELMTGKPGLFVDRADYSEGAWLSILDNPFGKVKYMLVATKGNGDLTGKRYPGVALGTVAGLVPIFHTERYVLVQLEAGASAAAAGRSKAGTQPHLVTPKAPLVPPPAQKVAPSEAGLSPTTGEETGTTAVGGAVSPATTEAEVREVEANSAPKVEGE
ncbi:MAG TPA: hypothetical protein VIJ21_04255 [Solirubrobacterales bacterium]